MTRLLDGFDWVPSDQTNVRATMKAHGYVGPQERARSDEQQARYDGALRAMKQIQAEPPKATVTPLRRTKTAKEKENG